MDYFKIFTATAFFIAAFPALIGVMSFVTWQNGFKMLGCAYICRMTVVMAAIPWVFALIESVR